MKTDVVAQNGRTNLYSKMLGECMLVCLLLVMLVLVGIVAHASAFTPGEGGHITDVAPFTSTPNMIAGLYVTTNHRYPDSWGSGTDPELNLKFSIPSTYGATSVTLQYSVDGSNWLNFQANGTSYNTSVKAKLNTC